jgi:hypothetical protein
VSAFPALILSLCIEDVSWSGLFPHSVFGFFNPSLPYCALGYVMLVVVIPGGLGHTLMNFIVDQVSPLVISGLFLI